MRRQSERCWSDMKEKRERILSITIVLCFLFVILGFLGAGYYDRTFYALGPAQCFSLDRGTYKVSLDAESPEGDSFVVYYQVNGQERILARAGAKTGVGTSFTVHLPSNIRNDSVRAVLLDAAGRELPQVDAMRITRVLPVSQTVSYLVLYLLIVLFLHKGFGGGGASCLLTGLVSAGMLPLYPVYCAAPFRMTVIIMTGMSLLFLVWRKMGVSKEAVIRYVFFLSLSLIALFFCTQSSPFYARNPWDDVSIYYSIGRGITQGYVPYRDMFDHKGPVVFFLFALAHLMVPDCFYGVYLLESLSFSGLLAASYGIYRLYFEEKMAGALTVISMVFLLDGSFLGYGGSCEEFTMVIYGAVLYGYLAYFTGRKDCKVKWMAGAGVLLGLSFWMKFNMTVCLFVLVGMVFLHKLLKRRNILKELAAFSCGFAGVCVLVAGYFICADSIGDLKTGYFDAKLAYAAVTTGGESLALFFQNVLMAVCDNPGTSLFVLLGLIGFVFSSRFLCHWMGKAGLVSAFALLVGSTYISYAFLYYYCLVAVFVIPGIITAAHVLTKRALKKQIPKEAAFYLALPCLCVLLFFNQNHRDGAVFSKNFTLCDVCEKEIENAAKGPEKTILLYHNHRVQMMTFAGMRPAARYYFAPNISKHVPEINEEQDRYIHEGTAEFVMVDHVELYPTLMEWGLYQYEQILNWELEGESVQLYCRRR